MKITAEQKAAILIAALQNLDKLMFDIDSVEDSSYSRRSPILPITIKDLTFTMHLEASLSISGHETDGIRTHMEYEPKETIVTDVEDDGGTFLCIEVDGENVFEYSIMDNLVEEIVIPMIREKNVN